jgi:hypothetical protein
LHPSPAWTLTHISHSPDHTDPFHAARACHTYILSRDVAPTGYAPFTGIPRRSAATTNRHSFATHACTGVETYIRTYIPSLCHMRSDGLGLLQFATGLNTGMETAGAHDMPVHELIGERSTCEACMYLFFRRDPGLRSRFCRSWGGRDTGSSKQLTTGAATRSYMHMYYMK